MLQQVALEVLIVTTAASLYVTRLGLMLNLVLRLRILSVYHVRWDQQIPIMIALDLMLIIIAPGNVMMATKNHQVHVWLAFLGSIQNKETALHVQQAHIQLTWLLPHRLFVIYVLLESSPPKWELLHRYFVKIVRLDTIKINMVRLHVNPALKTNME
jgi:hypothetical protein